MLVGELGWTTARVIEAQEERAASAERSSASKNMFLRNMSHEIRTPIAAMLGFAELLASDPSSQDRPDLLRRLQANGLAVMSLLDDLLDLARLDADKIVLTPEPVSVIDLVREVLASLEIESTAKSLQMRVDATNEALGSLLTDRYRLRQILVNLVANAVKFTEAGSVTVSLRATHALDEGYWTIDITDTGIGITADQRRTCSSRSSRRMRRSRGPTAATVSGWRSPESWPISSAARSSCCTAHPAKPRRFASP